MSEETKQAHKLGQDFRFFVAGRAVSVVGDRIALIALVFLVLRLSHRFAPALALFYVSRVIPALVGGLLIGVVVDHLNRQRLMIACDLGRGALLVAVPALSELTVWALYPMVMILYALSLFFETASRAALPDVVPEAEMIRANAVLRGIDSGADLAYAVGGSLIFILDLQTPFYVDAATFIFSAFMIWQMRIPRQAVTGLSDVGAVLSRIRDGIDYILNNPFLKWSTFTFAVAPVAGGAMFVLVPLYADRVLGRSKGLVGPMTSGAFRFSALEVSLGIGALIGSIVTVQLAKRQPRGRLFGLGILGMGIVDLSFAAIDNIYVAVGVMAVHGLFSSLFVVASGTLAQNLTPTEVRGRVTAARSTITYGALAIGSAVGGILLVSISYRSMWLLIGGTIATSSLFVWLRPQVRDQR